MKVAELEDELRERGSEHEALKLAMKILEEENQRFRAILASGSQVTRQVKVSTPTRRRTSSPSRSHSRHSSKSSSSLSIGPSVPGSPRASPQYLTPSESSPWVGDTTHPGKTPTTAREKETTQPQLAARSLPPAFETGSWADASNTPHHTSAPPEMGEPDEGASAVRSST